MSNRAYSQNLDLRRHKKKIHKMFYDNISIVDCGEDVKLKMKQEIESNLDNTISVESKLEAESIGDKKK